jgi:hypothetical protein
MENEKDNSGGPKQKSVRFSKVIEDAGKPQVALLWQDPRHDPSLQSALRQNRVMTVQLKHTGSASDFGVVGFKQSPHAEYLIFPKSLKAFEGDKVVGIKYELIAPSKPQGPALKASRPARAPSPPKAARPPIPKREPRFRVQIQYAAEVEQPEEVEAPNAAAARKKALEQTANRTPDFGKARIDRRAGKVTKVSDDS